MNVLRAAHQTQCSLPKTKTFVNKRRYIPAESEVVADSKFSGGAFSLHCVEETLPSAAYADEMNPVHVNPATSVYKRFAALPYADKPEVVSQKAGLELPSSADIKRRGVEGDAENRPYKCSYCPWAFKKYSNLLSHIDTHNGLKPYVCDLCGKAYSHQGTLQQHKRLHTGERPYSCPFCDKTYTWSSDYRKHIRTHTGEKPYACEACGKEFVRSSDLRKHERNMCCVSLCSPPT
uniref:C2H2-type domain-containing protein n=1 Tax=Pygocentrus nattereri TaxID=42514 RepID=A0A3B4BUJ2_PYGNA